LARKPSATAIKANPHPEIIRILASEGLGFDVSSSYEAAQLLEQHIPGSEISLSSQQSSHNMSALLQADVKFVATSMHQLELFAAEPNHPSTAGLQVNPGIGSGHNNRFTTGGLAASIVVGHASETGDVLTPAPHNPESILTRSLRPVSAIYCS
jgi:diaminopimelate decarboxylase